MRTAAVMFLLTYLVVETTARRMAPEASQDITRINCTPVDDSNLVTCQCSHGVKALDYQFPIPKSWNAAECRIILDIKMNITNQCSAIENKPHLRECSMTIPSHLVPLAYSRIREYTVSPDNSSFVNITCTPEVHGSNVSCACDPELEQKFNKTAEIEDGQLVVCNMLFYDPLQASPSCVPFPVPDLEPSHSVRLYQCSVTIPRTQLILAYSRLTIKVPTRNAAPLICTTPNLILNMACVILLVAAWRAGSEVLGS